MKPYGGSNDSLRNECTMYSCKDRMLNTVVVVIESKFRILAKIEHRKIANQPHSQSLFCFGTWITFAGHPYKPKKKKELNV